MARRLKAAALQGEVQGLSSLLASLDDGDFIGRSSLSYRLSQVEADLANVMSQPSNLGSVILSFDGGPVIGSRGVDAEFASAALHTYQELITKQMAASENGGLPQRGPVPSKNTARLNITNFVAGSFGFQLEEEGTDEPEFIESAVHKSIAVIDEILVAFASTRDDDYNAALSSVDRRVFIGVKKFYETLYRDSASIKITEDDKEYNLDHRSVLRARDRINGVDVEDEEFRVRGQLLGIAPIQRRFDLMDLENNLPISGTVGQQLSSEYLSRLDDESRVSGRVYHALITRRTATSADGSVRESFTLLDLVDPPEGGYKLASGPPRYIR